jgi:hypothetical protein
MNGGAKAYMCCGFTSEGTPIVSSLALDLR